MQARRLFKIWHHEKSPEAFYTYILTKKVDDGEFYEWFKKTKGEKSPIERIK